MIYNGAILKNKSSLLHTEITRWKETDNSDAFTQNLINQRKTFQVKRCSSNTPMIKQIKKQTESKYIPWHFQVPRNGNRLAHPIASATRVRALVDAVACRILRSYALFPFAA